MKPNSLQSARDSACLHRTSALPVSPLEKKITLNLTFTDLNYNKRQGLFMTAVCTKTSSH